MAKKCYVGVDGVACKVKKGYVGVDGVARKIKRAYIGIGGVARPCWSGGELAYYWPELEPKAMAESFEKGLAHWKSSGSVEEVKAWASKFSWDACADAYMQLYLKLLSEK